MNQQPTQPIQEAILEIGIEVTYQPINKMWGANIKKGDIIANEVDENLLVALKNIGETILVTHKLKAIK